MALETTSAIDMDQAMQADAGWYAFDVRTGNITAWHGTLLAVYPPYSTKEVAKIDLATARKIGSGEIDRTKMAYALRMGSTVDEFLASLKPAAKGGAKGANQPAKAE